MVSNYDRLLLEEQDADDDPQPTQPDAETSDFTPEQIETVQFQIIAQTGDYDLPKHLSLIHI